MKNKTNPVAQDLHSRHSGNGVNIKFGTSGWRGIISRDFTYDNLELATSAIARYLHKSGNAKKGIIVGYDTRFMSDLFAKTAADVLSNNGIPVFLTDRDTPTPAIAYHIIKKHAAGAINISASHNPPEYSGIKYSSDLGGPADDHITHSIEKEISSPSLQKKKKPGKITIFDPKHLYLKRLEDLIDFSIIRKRKPKIAIDCRFGTSRGYLDYILKKSGAAITVLNNYIDPLFGGGTPNTDAINLSQLKKTVLKTKSTLGLATDGDADRFGIIDRDGSFISANEVIAIVLDYLVRIRKLNGPVVRSITTTQLVDAIAFKHGRIVCEVPVGFKYIGKAMLEDGAVLGAEESAGMSIQKHVPEKDGILACLLIAEIVAHENKSLKEILKRLHKTYGSYFAERIDIKIKAHKKELILEHLEKCPKKKVLGLEVKQFEVLANKSFRYTFTDGSWTIIRPSGTEPILRCYAETRTKSKLKSMEKVLKKLITI